MLIDGEKYACDACVRGHRVSNCQHTGKCATRLEINELVIMKQWLMVSTQIDL